jgi:hypothetical protein
VWDYTDEHVLILTNYHTWNVGEFKYCFPPKNVNKKRKFRDDEHENLTLINRDGLRYDFALTKDSFSNYVSEEFDYVVLKLPKSNFTIERIPISLDVHLTLKIHAFGYIGHTKEFNISGGEVSGNIPSGFTMNLLSAPGFSGAAIVADYNGRAVGYLGGNYDASIKPNSQHQSYAFRFDVLVTATKRQMTPTSSPTSNVRSSSSSNK